VEELYKKGGRTGLRRELGLATQSQGCGTGDRALFGGPGA
jgi:hypothetical protein